MKSLKKNLLIPVLISASAVSQAELTTLNDTALSDVIGRSGLTIDIETKRTIGEFAYQDDGFIVLQGMSVGGSTSAEELAFSGGHGFLDNMRMNLDVAGNGAGTSDNEFAFGFSNMTELANIHTASGNIDAGMLLASGATTGVSTDEETGLDIDVEKVYGDGDLVIHISYTDAWQKGGGYSAYSTPGVGGDDGSGGTAYLDTINYSSAREIISRAVDFNNSWDIVGVASEDYEPGSKGIETYLNATTGKLNGTNHQTGLDPTANTTAYLSGIDVNGYLGPLDIHIENNGNGFGADGSGLGGQPGTGNADSKITGDLFFKVDYDIYIDIAGLQLTGILMHNERGDLGSMHRNETDTDFTSSFGFAHGRREIYAVKDSILNPDMTQLGTTTMVDGMGYNTEFKGDIDLTEISFGDSVTSIGSVYLTDIRLTRDWNIFAH